MRVHLLILGFLIFAGCTGEVPKLVPGTKDPVNEQQNETVTTAEEFDPKVDILLIVDESGSMQPHQQNLAKNARLFVDSLTSLGNLDYHIGVLTSDMISNDRKGRLFSVGSSPLFITPDTKDGDKWLKYNMQPGDGGPSTEAFFDPVLFALTDPLVTSYNKGFLRKEAHLAIIFITDTDDQSRTIREPEDFYDFLLKLKDNDPRKVLTYGALAHFGSGCTPDEFYSNRLEKFLTISDGIKTSICSSSFGQDIADIAIDVAEKIEQVIYLTGRPIEGTIEVKFGTRIIPNDKETGWIYNPSRNILTLGKAIDLSGQPPGTKLSVNYLAKNF